MCIKKLSSSLFFLLMLNQCALPTATTLPPLSEEKGTPNIQNPVHTKSKRDSLPLGIQNNSQDQKKYLLSFGGNCNAGHAPSVASSMVRSQTTFFENLKAEGWDGKILSTEDFSKFKAIAKKGVSIQEKDWAPADENHLFQEIDRAIENLKEGDQFLLHMATHGSKDKRKSSQIAPLFNSEINPIEIGHRICVGEGKWIEVNSAEFTKRLQHLKDKGVKIGAIDTSCYGGATVKEWEKFGCILAENIPESTVSVFRGASVSSVGLEKLLQAKKNNNVELLHPETKTITMDDLAVASQWAFTHSSEFSYPGFHDLHYSIQYSDCPECIYFSQFAQYGMSQDQNLSFYKALKGNSGYLESAEACYDISQSILGKLSQEALDQVSQVATQADIKKYFENICKEMKEVCPSTENIENWITDLNKKIQTRKKLQRDFLEKFRNYQDLGGKQFEEGFLVKIPISRIPADILNDLKKNEKKLNEFIFPKQARWKLVGNEVHVPVAPRLYPHSSEVSTQEAFSASVATEHCAGERFSTDELMAKCYQETTHILAKPVEEILFEEKNKLTKDKRTKLEALTAQVNQSIPSYSAAEKKLVEYDQAMQKDFHQVRSLLLAQNARSLWRAKTSCMEFPLSAKIAD